MLDFGDLYDVGMTNNSLDTTQDAELAAWLAEGGYASADDWAADSDYHYNADRGEWYDEDDNWIDPAEQAWWAMEASAE